MLCSRFAALVSLVAIALAQQDVIVINSPKPNDILHSKKPCSISYTVVGSQTTNPPLTNANYPTSLQVDFVWKQHTNTSNSLSFNALKGLDTSPYPSGSKNVDEKGSFQIPNCHFFSRYPPAQYDFSIVFTPVYATTLSSTASTGPQQSQIIVSVGIAVDNSSFPKC